jgi:hypothetical protein
MTARRAVLRGLAAAALPGALWPARAAMAAEVDLALVLAMDCSYSVDAAEFALQTGGMAAAFEDPQVRAAIAANSTGTILVSVVQWSSQGSQVLALPWRMVDAGEGAERVAGEIASLRRATADGATSVSAALTFSAQLFGRLPFSVARRVIDLSGDGRNNTGPRLALARDYVLGRGVTINGLAILQDVATLHIYFEQRLIGGTGAFVQPVATYTDFAEAFRLKLLREISMPAVS